MRKLLIPRKWRHFLRSEKKILVNGKYLPLNFLVKPGDKIEIQLDHIESDQQPYPASGKLPKVVYEDNDILIINKNTFLTCSTDNTIKEWKMGYYLCK